MILLPNESIEILKLQRSNYKKAKLEYSNDMSCEFNSILPFLPKKINQIIDIGCGLGGIDILLSRHFNNPLIYMIDKNKISDKIIYGFTNEKSFYNNFEILNKIMEMNKIDNYHLIDSDNFKVIKDTDLIISFLACGFHFPLSVYFEKIFNSLNDKGVFICDIRKGQKEQIKLIELYFKNVEEIKTNNPKTIRICAREALCQG